MPTDLELALQAGGKVIQPTTGFDEQTPSELSTPGLSPELPETTQPPIEETDLQIALKSGGKVESPREEIGAAPFFHRAIAQTAGFPADIATKALNILPELGRTIAHIPDIDVKDPFGGTESIERGFKSLGIKLPPKGAKPQTASEYAGVGMGEAAALFIPFAGATKKLSKGTKLVNRVAKSLWDNILKHPYISYISEIMGGGGVGVGRFVGEEYFPESPLIKQTIAVAGGISAGMLPVALTVTPIMIAGKLGKTVLTKVLLPFTEEGAKFRAGKFLKAQVTDPDIAAGRATEKTIGSLPPAVASREKKLMSLYKQFSEVDPIKDHDMIENLSKSMKQLVFELQRHGYSSPEILKNIAIKRVTAIEFKMQNRITDAMTTAQKKIDALPVAQRQSKESIIVRNELDKAMRTEFDKTKILWGKVPKDIEINPDLTRQVYDNIVNDLSKAELQDVPGVLKRSFLSRKRKTIVKFTEPLGIKQEVAIPVNVKEMQGLRSKLLEVQRIAKKDGQWNKARISGEIAGAILNNLEKEGVDEALQVAITATRQFKEKFERGVVGKILGYSKSGAPAISPDLTLDVSIGRAGTIGAKEAAKVAITPEAKVATERYLSRSFTDFVTDQGTKNFNVNKANKWVENNREILDQFPGLRNKLSDVSNAQKFADDTLKIMTARKERLKDPKISMTAKFLKSDPNKEIDLVFKSPNLGKMTDHLIKLSRNDQTGEAMEGLKSSFVDYIIEKSSVGPYNEIGERTLSGKVMLGFIGKNHSTLKKIFTAEDMIRMNKIGMELAELEALQHISKDMVKFQLEDAASKYLHMISRIGGARIGGLLARETPGGSLQTAAIFSKRFGDFTKNLVKDRADQLIHDAILADDGGKLLKSLLLPIDKPTVPWKLTNFKELNARMNLWLLGTGKRVLDDIQEEINQQPKNKPEKQGATSKLSEFKGGEKLGELKKNSNNNFAGQIEKGNIDLTNRPKIQNPDGTVSTEISFSIGVNGKEVLIPQIVNGKILSQEDAIKHYKRTGEHLGIFDSIEAANAAAKKIHNRESLRKGR